MYNFLTISIHFSNRLDLIRTVTIVTVVGLFQCNVIQHNREEKSTSQIWKYLLSTLEKVCRILVRQGPKFNKSR